MALPAQSYVWFRVRHVVGLWVARETGLAATAVLYDLQNQPRPALPYVGLARRSFPLDFDDEALTAEVPTQKTLTVTASVAGETVAVRLFGLRYAYTLQVGDTTTDARDALLALMEVDRLRTISAGGTSQPVGFQPITLASSGADAIVFTGFGLGPAAVDVIEGGTLTVDTLEYRSIQAGLRRAIVRLDMYWPAREDGFATLDETAEALRSSLTNMDTAVWLAARGVGVNDPARISIQDASAVSGGARQRRRFMDVTFNAQAVVYRPDNGIVDVADPVIDFPPITL